MASTKQQPISKLVTEARSRALLTARVIDALPESRQTELDLQDMIRLTQTVVKNRLTKPGVFFQGKELVKPGHYEEHRKDAKNQYTHLFASIRNDAVEVIRETYTDADGVPAKGIVLQKYNTVVLDSVFDALKAAGPERAISLMNSMTSAFIRDQRTLGPCDELDAHVAKGVLAKLSKARANRNKKPLTKAQRLAAIANAVERIQP